MVLILTYVPTLSDVASWWPSSHQSSIPPDITWLYIGRFSVSPMLCSTISSICDWRRAICDRILRSSAKTESSATLSASLDVTSALLGNSSLAITSLSLSDAVAICAATKVFGEGWGSGGRRWIVFCSSTGESISSRVLVRADAKDDSSA